MLFASLLRLFRPASRKLAVELPASGTASAMQLGTESARTEPLCAPAQIVPLVTRSMHEFSTQRPTITVWIGDTSYLAMVV